MKVKNMAFGDFASFKYGKMPNKKLLNENGKYPVFSGYRYVGRCDDYNTEPDTLVVVARGVGGTGDVKLTKEKCYLTNLSIGVTVHNSCVMSKYLYYYFLLNNLRWLDSGSAQSQITISDLTKVILPIPDMASQKKIVSMLQTIDEKIEENERINKNLEQQAQAIYADYIDSHQTSHVTLDQVVLSANTGADAIQKAPIVDYDTGVRCVRVGDMSNNRPFHEWGFTEVTHSVYKQYQLHEGDIVVTRTATLGLNRLIANDIDAVYNNGLIRLCIDTNEALPIIVYRQFQTEDFKNYIGRISGETSVRPNMKINYLLKYEFEIIPLQEQRELASMLSPLFELQEMLIHQNQELALLRDALLPKLMSGELDVSALDL